MNTIFVVGGRTKKGSERKIRTLTTFYVYIPKLPNQIWVDDILPPIIRNAVDVAGHMRDVF